MKKTIKMLAVIVGLLLAASFASAQTILVNTTLSAAVPNSVQSTTTTGNQQVISVASATGISAASPNTGNTYGVATSEAQDYLYVDRELMEVKAVSSTNITVIRGVGGTSAAPHASGALVFVVPAQVLWGGSEGAAAQSLATPQGACTRSNEPYLPRIQFSSGTVSDCLNGQWVTGDATQTQRSTNFEYQFPTIGVVAYTSAGSSTTKAANTMYCTEFILPYSKLLTGLAVLNGASTGTDKMISVFYSGGGELLANSAVAGTVASGSSSFQKRAFLTPYYAVGPAQYFACVQGDSGTTATLNLLATGTSDFVLTQSYGSQTFGTIPGTITPPTTFGTLKGPIFFVY